MNPLCISVCRVKRQDAFVASGDKKGQLWQKAWRLKMCVANSRRKMVKKWLKTVTWLNMLITTPPGIHWSLSLKCGWGPQGFQIGDVSAFTDTAAYDLVGGDKLIYAPLFIFDWRCQFTPRRKPYSFSPRVAQIWAKKGFGHGGLYTGGGHGPEMLPWFALEVARRRVSGSPPPQCNPDPPYFQTCPWTSAITHSRFCRWKRSSACF